MHVYNYHDLTILFAVSNPNINLTAPAVQNFMESLTLTCEVTTVRGITSRVTIIWTSLDNEVGRVENAIGNNSVDSLVVYRDQFFISALTSEDRYDCRAVINSTSQPQNVASIRLELTCKCMLQAYIHTYEYTHTHIHILLFYTYACICSNYSP